MSDKSIQTVSSDYVTINFTDPDDQEPLQCLFHLATLSNNSSFFQTCSNWNSKNTLQSKTPTEATQKPIDLSSIIREVEITPSLAVAIVYGIVGTKLEDFKLSDDNIESAYDFCHILDILPTFVGTSVDNYITARQTDLKIKARNVLEEEFKASSGYKSLEDYKKAAINHSTYLQRLFHNNQLQLITKDQYNSIRLASIKAANDEIINDVIIPRIKEYSSTEMVGFYCFIDNSKYFISQKNVDMVLAELRHQNFLILMNISYRSDSRSESRKALDIDIFFSSPERGILDSLLEDQSVKLDDQKPVGLITSDTQSVEEIKTPLMEAMEDILRYRNDRGLKIEVKYEPVENPPSTLSNLLSPFHSQKKLWQWKVTEVTLTPTTDGISSIERTFPKSALNI